MLINTNYLVLKNCISYFNYYYFYLLRIVITSKKIYIIKECFAIIIALERVKIYKIRYFKIFQK